MERRRRLRTAFGQDNTEAGPLSDSHTQAYPPRALGSFVDQFSHLYPDEIASRLEQLDARAGSEILKLLGPVNGAEVLSRISGQVASEVFAAQELERRVELLESMEPARAVALMGRISDAERNRTIEAMPKSSGHELRRLLDYPIGSAGHLMDPLVTTLRADTTVEEALQRVRGQFPRRVLDVFVVDSDGRLSGSASLQDVATARAGTRLGDIAKSDPPRVGDMASREEIAEILESKRISSLPVVDFEHRVMGVIRYDALMDTVERQATSDMQSMVGASREERALSKVSFAVRKRLPWLQVNLLTAFVAAAVVGLFEDTIAQFTALAVLLPVVAGQSGNTGAQALAVIMRGLSLREITPRHWLRVVTKEALVGVLNGIAVALVTGLAVFLWSSSVGLAVVISTSMVASMAMAAMAGAAIPILLQKIGQDPAQSSSIVLTTVTDVTGFLSFLGLATLFSSIL
jgi:magnesium transporter